MPIIPAKPLIPTSLFFGSSSSSSSSPSSSSLSGTISSPSTSTSTKWALSAIGTYCAAWGVYYLAQDSTRRLIIRRRRKRHLKQIRAASKSSASATTDEQDEAHLAAGVDLTTRQDLIVQRFSHLSVLGRYANPFPEWREQGAWEFLVWKAAYMLTTRKIWSDGGLSEMANTEDGRDRISKALGVKTPTWGLHTHRKSKQQHDVSPPAAEESWQEVNKDLLTESRIDLAKSEHPASAATEQKITYTWFGQSSFLLSHNNVNVLTDPVFSMQPLVSRFSPTRLAPAPFLPATFSELTQNIRLDAIVVSHNHYDHFDASIVPYVDEETWWVVPTGMKGLLRRNGAKRIDRILELDWWQDRTLDFGTGRQLKVLSVPAMHWSARTPLDTNLSLWCSWSLCFPSSTSADAAHVFFSGDTGYSPTFYPYLSTIFDPSNLSSKGQSRFPGPPHLALLPIGSYAPEWHMSPQHMSPLGAISLGQDLGAKQCIGMHFGTWSMSDEAWWEPVELLQRGLRERGLVSSRQRQGEGWFVTVGMGQTGEVRL